MKNKRIINSIEIINVVEIDNIAYGWYRSIDFNRSSSTDSLN